VISDFTLVILPGSSGTKEHHFEIAEQTIVLKSWSTSWQQTANQT